MDPISAIAAVNALITLATNALANAGKVSALIAERHAQGKQITQADLDAIVGGDDVAKKALQDAIASAGT